METQFSNQEVAQTFRDIADSMEVLGEARFKFQAYSRAADEIDALPTSLYTLLEDKALRTIPGVGPAIEAKIGELLTTGRMQFRDRLRDQLPDGVLDVVRLPGIGPKRALMLYREHGIDSRAALEAAVRAEKLRSIKGLGAKFEARVLESLQAQKQAEDRFLLGELLPLAREIVAVFRAGYADLIDVSIAGSIRRAAPTVGDIDLVAAATDPAAALAAFAALPVVAAIDDRQERRIDIRMHNGKCCSLFVTDPDAYGATLAMWTGSAAHREQIQQFAAEQGFDLREDGLFCAGDRVSTPDEAALFRALGLAFIAPELRENRGEIAAAKSDGLPKLVELADLRADMHTHSEWSDGRAPIRTMVDAAIKRGYKHYVVTDHGQYMGMVNGLDAERLRQQRAEIDAINEELRRDGVDFVLLQGIEVDILPDGSLALPDEALAALDWVIASPHVRLHQDRDVATHRLVAAMQNPHVDCLGHPTGRKLLSRQGSDLDMDAVLQTALETGTVLEVDGAYERLDLDSEHVQRALAMGISIAIDSDAHHPRDLVGIEYGVLTARRGWATRDQVVNCWSWDEIRQRTKARAR